MKNSILAILVAIFCSSIIPVTCRMMERPINATLPNWMLLLVAVTLASYGIASLHFVRVAFSFAKTGRNVH